jgi:hypothetical protein
MSAQEKSRSMGEFFISALDVQIEQQSKEVLH